MKYYFHPWFRDKGCPECGRRTDEWPHRLSCAQISQASCLQTARCSSCSQVIPPGKDRIAIQFPGGGSYLCSTCDVAGKAQEIMDDMIASIAEPPQPSIK